MKIKLIIVFVMFSSLVLGQKDEEGWTLQECIDYALENNLDVQRGRLTVQSADIDLQQSKRALLPDANITGDYSWNWGRSIDPTTNLFVDNQRIVTSNGTFLSSIPVFNGFNLRNTIKQNQSSFEATQKDLETTKNNVVLNVITLYTNVLFNRELLENSKKQLNSTEQQLERTSRQVEAGALPKANLLDLLAQEATNELNVVTSENNYKLSKIQLKQALQLPPETNIDIIVPEINVEENLLDVTALEVYEIALNNMPEIQSADLNKESSEWAVKAAKGNLYPSVTLRAGFTTRYSDGSQQPVAFDDVFIDNPNGGDRVQLYDRVVFDDGTGIQAIDLPSRNASAFETIPVSDQLDDNLSRFIQFNLRIPIFNRFQTRAGIQQAVINQDRAAINVKDAKYQLWQTIEQAYIDVEAASKSYYASLKQVEAREESFRITKQRYELGALNFIDYQIAENDLFQSQSDLVRAKYDYIFRLKILDFYQGKPLNFN
ncbi:MAG: TolC family protein [Cytophagales bacterium]|nr:TolC family protein [Cytophagales bacterium]